MEAKKLLKKYLDIHITKGEYRSEKQLIQLRYDASIDAINEALTIHSVSQQRELLKVLGKHIAEQYDLNPDGVIEQLEWKHKNL